MRHRPVEKQTPSRTPRRQRLHRLMARARRLERRGRHAEALELVRRARQIARTLRAPSRGQEPLLLEVRGTRHLVDAHLAQGFCDTVVDVALDVTRAEVRVGGKTVDLHGKEKQQRLLVALIRRAGTFLCKRTLVQYAWQRRYNSEFDDGALYFQLHALRRTLGAPVIESTRDGYRIVPGVRAALLRRTPRAPTLDLRETILQLAQRRGHVDNRTLRSIAGTSESTVLRALRALLAEGRLERVGGSRASRYVLRQDGAVAA